MSGAHHKSAASKVFHDNLIGDLSKSKTKVDAEKISNDYHAKHVQSKVKYN